MDVRWKQGLDNDSRALINLENGLALGKWNEFEQQGVIKAFELVYERAWKTLQDLLHEREIEVGAGPPVRSCGKLSLQDGLVMLSYGIKSTKGETGPPMFTICLR